MSFTEKLHVSLFIVILKDGAFLPIEVKHFRVQCTLTTESLYQELIGSSVSSLTDAKIELRNIFHL